MVDQTKLILEKLDTLKSDLDYIKRHIADIDIVLTEDDIEALEQAEIDFKEGKTKRLI